MGDRAGGTSGAIRGLLLRSWGDKTLVDAFVPFVAALEAAKGNGLSLKEARQKASLICDEAAQATAPLTPRPGRARPLAERSIGHPDAGAVSLALIAKTIAVRL